MQNRKLLKRKVDAKYTAAKVIRNASCFGRFYLSIDVELLNISS